MATEAYDPVLDDDPVQSENFKPSEPALTEVADADLRGALRLAIDNHTAAQEEYSRASSLVDNLWIRRASARSDVEAAQRALEAIKEAIVAGTANTSKLSAVR